MKVRSLILLVIGLTLLIAAVSALIATQTQTSSEFSDPDANVRRAAFRRLSEDKPEKEALKSIEVAEKGLSDPDEGVRFLSAATIWRVSILGRRINGVEWDKLPFERLANSLQQAATDESARVRVEATSALGSLIIRFRPDLVREEFLLDRLKAERDRKVRNALIACIAAGRYDSQEVLHVLVSLLTSEGDAYSAAQAIAAHAARPDRALPILVENLDPSDPPLASAFLQAIRSYGSKAVPHVPALEVLATRAENEELRQMFRQNIEAIKRSPSTTQGT
jgi:hypothetical protein